MNYRRLGRSGLKVSELALGSWTTYGGSLDDAKAALVIRRAFELGINLFDTADVYVRGAAETVLGKALQDLPREQVVIATKVMGRVWDGPLGAGLSRKHIFDAIDQSLKRLGTDYVDLYQLHAPDKDTPIEETLYAMEDLVRSGRVRYVGYSNYDHHAPLDRQVLKVQKANGWDVMVSSQPRYSLIDRHIEKDHLGFCKREGIGLIVYSPLAQGVLTNKYAGGAVPEGSRATTKFAHFLTQEKALTPENVAAAERLAATLAEHGLPAAAPVALAWVLRRPEVSSAIIGATSVAQLEENVSASDVKLTPAQWKLIEAAIAGPRPARATRAKPVRAAKPRRPAPARRRVRG
ncbi:MAG: aldo/keto reductase [Candidatus Eisenbacteria bacterium]|uniref:Aldo/keto reductase n=1 Tax=Eiseniibacteriota bacterium TaxID=2212470 RepID=A0A849SM70_UNCEI|nr:aldo/keto reductase [Candidatus Eisenbacteria bacterium]